jgi:hypothetical protein
VILTPILRPGQPDSSGAGLAGPLTKLAQQAHCLCYFVTLLLYLLSLSKLYDFVSFVMRFFYHNL